jgi:glycosyltransferase involved in cell wall biosynthesis
MTNPFQCLSVILPVYNEQDTLAAIVSQVLEQAWVVEVLAVDDCSNDRSLAILEQLAARDQRIRIFHHPVNQGKGAAIQTAIPHCKAQYVLIQDADLEYDPREYSDLLEPLLNGKADVVFGSRFLTTRSRRVLYYWHAVINQFLTLLTDMIANVNLTDMETCYKVFRREVLQALDLRENRFGFEPEVTIKAARMHCRIYEVGISYSGRTFEEGKKIRAKDGIRALWCLFLYGITARHFKHPPQPDAVIPPLSLIDQ